MIGNCPYWLQALIWAALLAFLGFVVRRIVEAWPRRTPRRKDLPWR